LGLGGILLGAGRKKAEDSLDYGAGIILHKKLGDEVTSGEPIATIFANDSKKLDEASKSIKNCFYLGKEEIQIQNLILDEWSV
jgi:thymidine phosphorylase